MRKVWLVVCGVLFFTSCCWAQDYYAFVQAQIKNESGSTFLMNTITKVADKKTCESILSPVNQLKDSYSIRTECLTGQEWEDAFGALFANQPAASLYISYRDPNGYETRINKKMLVTSGTPALQQLVDISLEESVFWAKSMLEALKKGGVKNAKIIYPRKEK